MHGTTPSLQQYIFRRGAQLKHRNTFTFTLTFTNQPTNQLTNKPSCNEIPHFHGAVFTKACSWTPLRANESSPELNSLSVYPF